MQEHENTETTNREKSYFLAEASHDLLQPLHAIQLFTNALEHTNPTPQQQAIIKKIDASINNFGLLLDNLLDISKLDFEKIKFEPQKFNLAVLLQHLCEEYHISAQRNGICVFCRYPSLWIESDYILLERIIRNLLSNAVKYTKGKVMLSCKQTKEQIIIRVIDNGIGIKPAEEQYIYDEFYQSNDVPDNKKLGAGLGLSIVKRLSRIINARVEMRSKPNKYTVFSLYLPHKN